MCSQKFDLDVQYIKLLNNFACLWVPVFAITCFSWKDLIYKVHIVYTFVNYQNEKSLYVVSNNELWEIIAYVEQYEVILIIFLILI